MHEAIAAQESPEGNVADQAVNSRLDTIVVTARKTEESLQRVPVSVAAFSGENLEKRSITDMGDLGQTTPNFTFSEQAQGGRVGGVAFIRGIGQSDTLSVFDPAVGIYMDGVYLGRMFGNNIDFMEIERVEVLRGPQGTLFGKNTSAGAVSIVTKKPDLSADGFTGHLQAGTGSRDKAEFFGGVNLPLIADKLALRVSGSVQRQDGYGVRVDGQEQADTHRQSARAHLLFQASDAFSVLLSGDWMKFDERNASLKLLAVNTSLPTVAGLNAFTPFTYDERWLSPRDYFNYGTGPNTARGEIWGTSGTLAYEAGWGSIKSITSYRELEAQNDFDVDLSPIQYTDQFQSVDQTQFSQELQILGTSFGDRLEWVLGGYYFHEEAHDVPSFNLVTPLLMGVADFSQFIFVENESLAAFGQATFSITPQLRFTAGLRFTHDEKDVTSDQVTFPGGLPIYPTQGGNHSSDSLSPRIGFDYQWTPSVMTYVSVAQGAKNGGIGGRSGAPSDFREFEDEVVWTYEAGLRSDLFDGVARFNATAFYSRYSDLQTQITGSTIVMGAPSPFTLITNIPKSNIKGGELEVLLAPAAGLTLSAGLGLTYAEYKELPVTPEFLAAGVITLDSEFPNTPKTSLTLGAEYTTALTPSVDVTGRIDYAYKSKIYYDAYNSPLLVQPSYGLLDARLTFAHQPSGISLSVYGKNLTDEAYIIGGFDDATSPSPGLGFAFSSLGAPREWGLSAAIQF